MRILFVFNHPAFYKTELLSMIGNADASIQLKVIFERQKNKDRNPKFYSSSDLDYQYLRGISFGLENHLSFRLIRLIKKEKFDRIIMNGYSTFTEMVTILYMIRHHIPYELYINGGIIRKDSKMKFKLKKKLISHAERYYSPSPVADEYLIHYGAKKDKIFHYPYATIYEKDIISAPLTDEQKLDIRKKYGIESHLPLFVSIGQFIPRKNNFTLLEQFKDGSKSLVLIGEGKEEKEYRKWMEEHPQASVFLLPYMSRKQLFPFLQSCDAYITLSSEDIYGHTINEALSQGLGVVSSQGVVAAKTLLNNQNGRIVDPQNHNQIQSAMNEILDIHYFEHAIKTAKQNTYEKSVEAHLEFWKEEK